MSLQSPSGPAVSDCQAAAKAPGFVTGLLRQFSKPAGPLGYVADWIMASRGSNRERSLWSIEQLEVEPGDRVLEIGYGPGIAVRRLAALASEGTVVGVDHSELMCRRASRRNAAAIRQGRVILHHGSVESLPALGDPFDKVLSVNGFQFWERPDRRLVELHARIAPGGRLAITLQPRDPGATDADALARGEAVAALVGAAGFAKVRCRTLELEPVNAVCVLAERRAPAGSEVSLC